MIKVALFDLDGVLVDTAKYHYLAWKRLANELGFEFTEKDNERLKGVSRMRSLQILLEIGNIDFDEMTKLELATKKNEWYVEYITKLDKDEILPGSRECLELLRKNGIKTALGSASKNAGIILERLDILELLDGVVDGNSTSRAKPDPEVFLLGAKLFGAEPSECVVFEDAEAGVEAAIAGGMSCIGIGDASVLKNANKVIPSLAYFDIKMFEDLR